MHFELAQKMTGHSRNHLVDPDIKVRVLHYALR